MSHAKLMSRTLDAIHEALKPRAKVLQMPTRAAQSDLEPWEGQPDPPCSQCGHPACNAHQCPACSRWACRPCMQQCECCAAWFCPECLVTVQVGTLGDGEPDYWRVCPEVKCQREAEREAHAGDVDDSQEPHAREAR